MPKQADGAGQLNNRQNHPRALAAGRSRENRGGPVSPEYRWRDPGGWRLLLLSSRLLRSDGFFLRVRAGGFGGFLGVFLLVGFRGFIAHIFNAFFRG